MNKSTFFFLMLACCLFSCSTSKKNYSPLKKYSPEELREDYLLLRNILEKKHPSLYWYTPKDSVDMYFNRYYQELSDSLTEQQFAWRIARLTAKFHCGHTSVSMSKAYSKWSTRKKFASFPLFMKIWNDSMVVTASLTRKDSIFKRGTLVTSINGMSPHSMIEKIFDYLPEDGYENSINYIRISNNFPYFHRNVFGLYKTYTVTYMDSSNKERTATVPVYMIVKDTAKKDSLIKKATEPQPKKIKQPGAKRLSAYRSLEIDSTKKFAVMTLNSFSKGKLRSFFRRSFKKLNQQNINNLILDVRLNGGGKVMLSTLLTKYLSRKPFKVADTLYTVSKSLSPYTKYIKGKFLNNIEMFFISKKMKDGQYHIRHLENKMFAPKTKNHYDGSLFVITSGPSFSATALFCNAIKGQPGVALLGENTGGGWYGNNGIMIPDIILPHTKIRVRLPLFRLVQYNHIPQKGTGVVPDIYIGPGYDAILKSYDKKMEAVKKMILKN